MEKNQIFEGEITGYNSDGLGICKKDNVICFVKGSVRGDVCLIRVVKVLKNFCYGIVEKLIKPSEHRISPLCPHFPLCGGCDLHHMTYDEELFFKKDKVISAMKRIGGIDTDCQIFGSPSVSHYRNKAQYPVKKQKGEIVTGFYRARSHDIVPMDSCLLQKDEANRLSLFVCDFWRRHGLSVYDEISGKGLLRHIYIRTSAKNMQLCLVINGGGIPRKDEFIKEVTSSFPSVSSVVLNIHRAFTNVVLGKDCVTIFGDGFLRDELCGNVFEISPLAFYQINHDQTERLYDKALEFAGLTGSETLLDLYCGMGTITLHMAKKAKFAYGIEIVPEAIENAAFSAKVNGVENVSFMCADAGTGAEKLLKQNVRPDVICVDPPRKGLDQKAVNAVLSLSPKKIVYVSCDCSTMARDVKLFCEAGYKFEKIAAFDMFPRTSHVETVVLLSKGEIDSKKVRVEFSLEDMDMSGFQKGATYEQIKAYVLEHSGLKVSSLYISQVKRKCGLEVGQNYNLSKKEDAKVPHCPPEKEAAIMEALKYFQMI